MDKDWKGRFGGAVGLTVIFLILIAIGIGGGETLDAVDYLTRPSLVKTQAVIDQVSTKYQTMSKGIVRYSLVGTYRFTVSGREYTGDQYGVMRHSSSWIQRDAEKMQKALASRGRVDVWYDPANPEYCYAEVADEKSDVHFEVGMLIVIGCVLVGCIIQWLLVFFGRPRTPADYSSNLHRC